MSIWVRCHLVHSSSLVRTEKEECEELPEIELFEKISQLFCACVLPATLQH